MGCLYCNSTDAQDIMDMLPQDCSNTVQDCTRDAKTGKRVCEIG